MTEKCMKRGSKIDFAHVKSMVFETYFERLFDSGARAVLNGNVLELHRGIRTDLCDSIPMAPALADELTQLFESCSVCRWKRTYEPKGYLVCDGSSWSLKLVFDDGLVFRSRGSNAWPEEWDSLREGLFGFFGLAFDAETMR